MANYESSYTGAQADAGVAGGILYAANKFTAATKAIFYQDTAPTTWTINNTLDDKLLFITKGSVAGGETGGGSHSTGTWTQLNHTHTGPSHTHTGPSHTHTGPSHTHTGPSHTHTVTPADRGGNGTTPGFAVTATWTSSASGTGATGAGGTGATGADGTGATGNGAPANTWRPAAYCAIIATKDAY